MRVIAGKYRSRKLETQRGLDLRPSSDRLRETLFNIVGPLVQDAVFLDLFAGSGAVGIEALSRGARHAVFVENNPARTALLRRNLASLEIIVGGSRPAAGALEFPGTAEILSCDVLAAMQRLEARDARADLLFVDPPYADNAAYQAVLEFLADSELLAHDGLAIFEHQRRRQLPACAGRLERTRVVTQGDAALSFFRVVLAA